MVHIEAIAQAQLFEVVGQLLCVRNTRPLEQNGNHRNIALQRRRYLNANQIVRIVEPPSAVPVGRVQPSRPDHCEERLALAHLVTHHFHEMGSKRNGVHVHESQISTEITDQSIVNAPRVARTVAPPVTDENLTWHVAVESL